MKTEMAYGTERIEVDLPEGTTTISGAAAASLPPVEDLEGTVHESLTNPLGIEPIETLVKPGARVTIAFDDATVASYGPVRRVVIEQLLARLEKAGVGRDRVTLICANALHRKFRPEELARLIGEGLVKEFGSRVFCHDAEDRENLVYLGRTPGGYDVEVSRYVTDSDLTVYVNAGYNRGFSGGWKSVCVGLSTYRSIRHHHTPDGMSMSITKNRMHDMLDEMGSLLESKIDQKIFKVDTVLASPQEVAKIYCGTVWDTRKAVLVDMTNLFPPRRNLSSERFDTLVYSVPNWSPYAVNSMMNPLLTLVSSGLGYLGGTVQALGTPGCTVIMVTPCPDQWDRVHHAPYPDVWENVLSQTLDPYEIEKEYAERYATHEEYIAKYRNEYAFHPVHPILGSYPLKRLGHIGKVIVAGAKAPELVRHLNFEPTETVEQALALAREIHGDAMKVAHIEQPLPPAKIAA